MTGLLHHDRDLTLPAIAGDEELCPLTGPELVELLRAKSDEPAHGVDWFRAVQTVEVEFSRWKPGVSTTTTYAIQDASGSRHALTLKRYRGDKARELVGRRRMRPDGSLVDADLGLHLFLPQADRELPGLREALDPERLPKVLDRMGIFAPRVVRKRPTQAHVLRYKPERRCVLGLDIKLRDPLETDSEARSREHAALRVLPPALAARVASARARLDPGAPTPRLLGADLRRGWLLEEWLEITPSAHDEFDHAELAGGLLARLHRPLPSAGPCAAPEADLTDCRALFSHWSTLASHAAQSVEPPASAASHVAHGDFHPDQVGLRAEGGGVLLDCDGVGPGDPAADLASWIADALAAGQGGWSDCSEPLLDGYRGSGGSSPHEERLRALAAHGLVLRAAAALRRLQRGAPERAAELLELAASLRPKQARPARRPAGAGLLDDALDALAGEHAGDAERVSRVEISKSGGFVLTVADAGRERAWYRWDRSSLSQLDPGADAGLPLAQTWRASAGEADVISWRPGRRVVCVGDTGLVKGVRPRSFAGLVARHRFAGSVTSDSLRTPRVLHADGETASFELERVPGEALDLRTLPAEQVLWAVGGAISTWKRDAARGEPAPGELAHGELGLHQREDELDVLRGLEQRNKRAGIPIPAGWASAFERLRERAEVVEVGPLVVTHRDLHEGQILVDRSGPVPAIGWIDLDTLCLAEVGLDAGNLLAHLVLRGFEVGRSRSLTDSAREALLRGWGLEPGRGDLIWCEAASALRLALVYLVRPGGDSLAPQLIRHAENILGVLELV